MKIKCGIIALVAFSLLAFFACERFDNNFSIQDKDQLYLKDFFAAFSDSIETILPTDSLSSIMEFYNPDYNNNGTTFADVENFYLAFYLVNTPLEFEATLLDTNNMDIDWHLLVTESSSGNIFMDTTITDVLNQTDDHLQFYGNQADMKNIIIELFTSTSCTYCPLVESALQDIKAEFGSRISYLEYHVGDELDANSTDLLMYYGATSLPTTVINGNQTIITGADDIYSRILSNIQPLLSEEPQMILDSLKVELTPDSLSGNVRVENIGNLIIADLKLRIALMENYNNDWTNHNGEYLHNIVLKRSFVDISQCDLSQPINFSITELCQLPPGYNELPDDLTLVLWLQVWEDEYNMNTCTVHNVLEHSLQNH